MPGLLSIIIPEFGRGDLAESLHTVRNQSDEINLELIVITDTATDSAGNQLRYIAGERPLVILDSRTGSQSSLLNRAMALARGEIIAFSTAGITVSSPWAAELLRAASTSPDSGVFCGPIIPALPHETPYWLYQSRLMPVVCSRFTPQLAEGPLPPAYLPFSGRSVFVLPFAPFGFNFAVRKSRLGDVCFPEHGAAFIQTDLLCGYTEFLDEFRKRDEHFIFVPAAGVTYRHQPENLTLPVQFERAFQLGRTLVAMDQKLTVNPTIWLDRQLTLPTARFFEMGMLLNLYYGQLYQLHGEANAWPARILYNLICAMDWSGDPGLLGASALRWLQIDSQHLPLAAKERFHHSIFSDGPFSRRTKLAFQNGTIKNTH